MGGTWCQLRVNKPIPIDRVFIFGFKIVKSEQRALVIGIVDKKSYPDDITPHQKHFIGFYGKKGEIFPIENKEGKGFY